jgi:AraC-like DNA-binding protein
MDDNSMRKLTVADEQFLQQLYQVLEENHKDPEFNMENCGQQMAMSNSQLYRKTVALTGLTPNNLLKELRLQKARSLIKRNASTIAQVTFDTGFASPSYFTKVFKKEYGLLPMQYLELLG